MFDLRVDGKKVGVRPQFFKTIRGRVASLT